MFKFDEYPEIKKAHKTSEKFDALTYKKEFAYEKSDKNEDRKKWATSIKNEKDFTCNTRITYAFLRNTGRSNNATTSDEHLSVRQRKRLHGKI